MLVKLGLALLVLPLVVLMGSWGMEYADVSSCIHTGNQYDYQTGQCVEGSRAVFIPFAERHPTLVSASFWLACAGLVMCLVGLYQSRR
ncbi:hypothetical protein [Marinospirillum perlucidum]|uniref:hypothetical protein n=1 Tax=Marinospirillum perlucidum TaxID=1982602 RepID=UPI000DF1B9E1|nr:hypothetical protein [Marinospirillum perlucidum]